MPSGQVPTNARTLDTIADDINKLDRNNIIDIGDLLIEAQTQCEHGQWLDWLDAEFDKSVATAERYMKVAKLSSKFRSLRNLKVGAVTYYRLVDDEDEEDLPAIIKELAKHATKTRLKPPDAERVIKIGIGRRRFGDHPDATLVQLEKYYGLSGWHEKVIAALLEREPKTDDEAKSIIDEIRQECEEAEREVHETLPPNSGDSEYQAWLDAKTKDQAEAKAKAKAAKDEAEAILDGAPPDLPPAKQTEEVKAQVAEVEAALTEHIRKEAEVIASQARTVTNDVNGRMTVTVRDEWREPLAKSAEYLGVPADEYAQFLMQLGQRAFNSKFQSMRAPAAHGLSNVIAWWLIEMHSKYPDTFNVGSWEGSCCDLAIDKLYAARGVPIGKFQEWQQAERKSNAKAESNPPSTAPPAGEMPDHLPEFLDRRLNGDNNAKAEAL